MKIRSFVLSVSFWTSLALAQGTPGAGVAPGAGPASAPEVIADASAVSTISQYGIAWTFQGKPVSGQFANGDYWVVGPVRIIRINPPSVEQIGTTTLTNFTLGGSNPKPRTMNGSMLNPMTGGAFGVAPKPGKDKRQGYDSEMYAWDPDAGRMYAPDDFYDAKLNVALGVNPAHPLLLQPDSSLISSISYESGKRPQLKAAAILTVLGSAPPDNGSTSFRPPYVGTNKPQYSIKTLRKDRLPNLPLVSSMPDLKAVIAQFQRPWIDHFSHHSDGTQYTSPSENMPAYGREYCMAVGTASLLLMLKEDDLAAKYGENKDRLLIRFVQLGIDLYHVTENGGYWMGNGGLNHGRKWPIIFAGLMLDNERMCTIGSRSKQMPYWGFAEDGQTKYIDQADVEMTHSPQWAPDKRSTLEMYEKSDIGLPEWNVGGFAPGLDGAVTMNKAYSATYRPINGMSYPGIILSALLMGQKTAWNHDALFDYTDRFVTWTLRIRSIDPIKARDDYYKALYVYGGAMQQAMWEAYRAKVDEIGRSR